MTAANGASWGNSSRAWVLGRDWAGLTGPVCGHLTPTPQLSTAFLGPFGLFDLAGSRQGEWLLLAASASNVRSGTASRTVPDRLLCTGGLHPSEDAVEVRSAHWTLGLSHPGALVVDVHLARGLALGLALHAIEL